VVTGRGEITVGYTGAGWGVLMRAYINESQSLEREKDAIHLSSILIDLLHPDDL
jgi:hypothetical protein